MEWKNCFLCLNRLDAPENIMMGTLNDPERNLYDCKRVLKYLISSDTILTILSEFISFNTEKYENCSKWVPQSCGRCRFEMFDILELMLQLEGKLNALRQKILDCSKHYGNNQVKQTFLKMFENEVNTGKDFEEKRAFLLKLYKFQRAVFNGRNTRFGESPSAVDDHSGDDPLSPGIKSEPEEVDIKCDPDSLDFQAEEDFLHDLPPPEEPVPVIKKLGTRIPPRIPDIEWDPLSDDLLPPEEAVPVKKNPGTKSPPRIPDTDWDPLSDDLPPLPEKPPPRVIKRRRKRGEPKEVKVKRKPGRPKVEKPPEALIPRIFTCADCGAKYMSNQALKEHRNIAHDGNAVTCTVEGCDKKFGSARRLRQHIAKHHGNLSIICEVCGAKFTSEGGHRKHVTIHQNQKSHVCAVCGKGFNLAHYLVAHMQCHEEGRNFVCECGKSFKHSAALYLHRKQKNHPKPPEAPVSNNNKPLDQFFS